MKKSSFTLLTVLFVSLLVLIIAFIGILSVRQKISELNPISPVSYGDFPITFLDILIVDNEVVSTPAVNGQVVFVRTSDMLYAFDVLENKLLWKVLSPYDKALSLPPVTVDALVVVVESGSSLAAFSTETGKLIWRTPEIEIAKIDPVTASIQAVAVNSKYIFVARFDWTLTAYDLKSGEFVWDYKVPGRTNPYVQANENNVVLAVGDTVKMLDAKTGVMLWDVVIRGYSGPIVLSNDTLYITDEKNILLMSLNVNTREYNWIKDYRSVIGEYEYSCVLDAENYLLVSTEKLMSVSKSDGAILWTTERLGTLECPLILGNKIFVRNTINYLYELDVASGQELGRLRVQANTPMQHEPFRSPVSMGNLLLVPFGDNRIFIYLP